MRNDPDVQRKSRRVRLDAPRTTSIRLLTISLALASTVGAGQLWAKPVEWKSTLLVEDQRAAVVHSGPSDGETALDAGVAALRKLETQADGKNGRKLKATWQHLHRWVPADAMDLVRADKKAKCSALGVVFSRPVEIDTIILDAFGQHVFGRNKEGARDYRLKCKTAEGQWVTVATVKNNIRRHLIHTFSPLTVSEIRVEVTAHHRYEETKMWQKVWGMRNSAADQYGIRRIEAYKLGSHEGFKAQHKSRSVKINKSPNGNVAIFKDDVPMLKGVASSPDYLAKVLRRAGYGVTFLDAELLANTGVLSKANFDLLVLPYGSSFPLGTTLYDFLEDGGDLVTIGGQAMTRALERTAEGRLVATAHDPGLITTPETMFTGDASVPHREQLGIFAVPWQKFVHAVEAGACDDQAVIDPDIRLEGKLEGYLATGMVGQLPTFEEEEQYIREGKELPYILRARRGAKSLGTKMHRLDHDENSYILRKTCSRWMPLLAAADRYGRPRGSVGAMMLNHDGLYPGSFWTCFGVTNRDLFAADNPKMAKALVDIVDFSVRGVYLHGLRSGYACYRQGEAAKLETFVGNFGPADQSAEVTFELLPLDGDKVAFSKTNKVRLPKGKSTRVEVTWAPERFDLDFYRIRCVLSVDGREIDRDQNGFVVWNEKAMQGEDAFKLEYKDNYFHDGDRPVFIVGGRDDGLHRHGAHGRDPLSMQRRYQQMQDCGMSIISPIFLQMYVPGFAWGEPLPELVPEVMLRQLDAHAQLCQQHKLIFAPNIFFAYRHDCLVKQDLSEQIMKLLGDRYCRVPGFLFYLWDDVWNLDGTAADLYLEHSRRCRDAINSNPAGREYALLSEHYRSANLGMRRTAEHLTTSQHGYNGMSCGTLEPLRLADARVAGKSQSCGEFYLWDFHKENHGEGARRAVDTPSAPHGHPGYVRMMLDLPHAEFGLGYSLIMNWKWGDIDTVTFCYGVVGPCDQIPRHHMYTYRNLSWFLRSFRPKYEQPEAMFLLPNAYWAKNKLPKEKIDQGNMLMDADRKPPAEVDRELKKLIKKVAAAGHINFGVVDEHDLPKLKPTVKAIVYPFPICPDEKTYRWLVNFVRRGGHLYLTSDFSYEPGQKRRLVKRLTELAGVEPVGPLDNVKVPTRLVKTGRPIKITPVKPYGNWTGAYKGRVDLKLRPAGAEVLAVDEKGQPVVFSHKLGKGRVVFNADYSAAAPAAVYGEFMNGAGVEPERADRGDFKNYTIVRVPTHDGSVYGLVACGDMNGITTIATSPTPVTLEKTRSPMVMAGFDTQGRVTACETDGLLKVAGRTIVDATATVMIFTLDGKPIDQSEAVVVLPQPFADSKITIRTAASVDSLIVGDMVGGKWTTGRQTPLVTGPKGVSFALDEIDSTCVVLLTSKAARNKYVKKLARFLSGHFAESHEKTR